MVSHEYFEELIPLFVLGALSKSERDQVRAHLEGCDSCRKRYRQDLATVDMIPRSVELVEPSRETKLKLFARVDADLAQQAARARPAAAKPLAKAPAAPQPRRAWFRQPVLAFAVIAALVLLAVAGWMLLQNTQSPDQRAIASILNDPSVQIVALNGTPDGPNASGQLFVVPGNSQAVLKVTGLEPLPADKRYEFWFIKGNDPQASSLFAVNPDGTMTVLLKANDSANNYDAWGVSIEPKEGVTKPTGPIVILGGG